MVIHGEQAILRPEDLPEGCELRSGKSTYICHRSEKVYKKEGVLS